MLKLLTLHFPAHITFHLRWHNLSLTKKKKRNMDYKKDKIYFCYYRSGSYTALRGLVFLYWVECHPWLFKQKININRIRASEKYICNILNHFLKKFCIVTVWNSTNLDCSYWLRFMTYMLGYSLFPSVRKHFVHFKHFIHLKICIPASSKYKSEEETVLCEFN